MAGSYQNVNTVNGQLLALWETYPDKVAMVFSDDDEERHVLTNRKVQELSSKMAAFLFSQGVHRGDVVCNMLCNSMEREIVNFGILLAGAVVMHGDAINSKGRAFWLPFVQARVRFIVVSPDPTTMGWKMVKDDVGSTDNDFVVMTRTPEAKGVYKVLKFRSENFIKKLKQLKLQKIPKSCFEVIQEHPRTMNERVSAHEAASILVEKDENEKHYLLVQRSHGEIVKISQRLDEMLRIQRDDVIYSDHQLGWLPGLMYNYITMGCTMVRSTLIDCPPRKVIAEIWDFISAEKCTLAAFEPKTLQMMSSHCEDIPDDNHRLRAVTTTGCVRQSVMDAIGPCCHSIIICYSKIETGLIACHHVDVHNKDIYAEGCVGDMTCSATITKPVRSDTSLDRLVPPTPVLGEIMLDGALVVKDYLNDKLLTKANFNHDGFLHTGDIGFYDEKKHLYVLGRKSDAIIRGNIPIFPRQIEEKVNQCPGLWKVKVVSVKDAQNIVQMCACVIPRTDDTVTLEGVKEYCRYQLGGTSFGDDNPHMPTYIFFFDSFPTIGGRTNRRLLAYMAAEILHGGQKEF